MVLDILNHTDIPSTSPRHDLKIERVTSRIDVTEFWQVMEESFGPSPCLEDEADSFYYMYTDNVFPGDYIELLARVHQDGGKKTVSCGRVVELSLPFIQQMAPGILDPLCEQIVQQKTEILGHSPFKMYGIFAVGTRTSDRRQGCATALLQELIRQAAQQGATHIGLAASPEGMGIYSRLGFVPIGIQRTFHRGFQGVEENS